MAARRMLAKAVMDSDDFLEMPSSTQLLYIHLGLNADDDGFVNCSVKICRMIGADPDELSLLIRKGYIIPFESGVMAIVHWHVHNKLRSDRYQPTMYKKELSMLTLGKDGIYRCKSGKPNDNHTSTQDSEGKDNSGKNSSDEHCFGEHKLIKLTDIQYEKLINGYGEALVHSNIHKMDDYCYENARKYNDYYLALISWIKKEINNGNNITICSDKSDGASYSTNV